MANDDAAPAHDVDANRPVDNSPAALEAKAFGDAISNIKRKEDEARQNGTQPVGPTDPDWVTVYSQLTKLSENDPEKGARESLQALKVLTPDSDIAQKAWILFRKDIDTLEHTGKRDVATEILAKVVAPDQAKTSLPESQNHKAKNGAPGADNQNADASTDIERGPLVHSTGGTPGAPSSEKHIGTMAHPSGVRAQGNAPADPAPDPNQARPKESPPASPDADHRQQSDTAEYLRITKNPKSAADLSAIVHSLSGVLGSPSLQDDAKTASLWKDLSDNATTVYTETPESSGRSDAQIRADVKSTNQDMQTLYQKLRADETSHASDTDRATFDEKQIAMLKSIALQGKLVLDDGTQNSSPSNVKSADNENTPEGQKPATMADGGQKFDVTNHSSSTPDAPLNSNPVQPQAQVRPAPSL